MLGISKLCITDIDRLAVNLVCPACIVSENGDSLGHILAKNNVKRFAIVPCINRGQNVLVTLTKVTQLPEKDTSLLWCEISPLRAGFESCSCRCNCCVDILLACGLYFGDDGLVVRVDSLDLLSGASSYKLIVDEEAWILS